MSRKNIYIDEETALRLLVDTLAEAQMSKPSRGGKRPRAGRPPTGHRKTKTSVALDPALLVALEREAARRGVSRNHLMETLLAADMAVIEAQQRREEASDAERGV